MNNETNTKIFFLVFYPVILLVIGLATSFNYIFITLGCIFCVLGIFSAPLIIRYLPNKVDDIPTKQGKAIYYVIFSGGAFCFIFLADIVNGNLTFISHIIQYFLTGSIIQAIHAFYIKK